MSEFFQTFLSDTYQRTEKVISLQLL